jgi:5-methylcytosine-specific restriction enzyme A
MTPVSPPSLCTAPGCGVLVYGNGKCDTHRTEARRESQARRPEGHARAYDARWSAFSKAYLKRHPTCACDECAALPEWRRQDATEVDHIDGRGPSGPRGYDWANCQALSKSHHSRKTATEDGGFGHVKRINE